MRLHDAATLARALMTQHGLMFWHFEFDSARRRFGQCRHQDHTISLSRYLVALNGEDAVRDTILHEIAHALVGPGHGHGRVWKAKCRAIGARPVRCYSSAAVQTPPTPWKARCPGCGREFKRHRLSRTGAKCLVCISRCGGYAFAPELVWTRQSAFTSTNV